MCCYESADSLTHSITVLAFNVCFLVAFFVQVDTVLVCNLFYVTWQYFSLYMIRDNVFTLRVFLIL